LLLSYHYWNSTDNSAVNLAKPINSATATATAATAVRQKHSTATIIPGELKPTRFTARSNTFMKVNSSIIITDIMIITTTVSSNYSKTAAIIPSKGRTTTTKVFALWGIIYQLRFHFCHHNYYFHYQLSSTIATTTAKP